MNKTLQWIENREKIKELKQKWLKNDEIADALWLKERMVYYHLAKMKWPEQEKEIEKEQVVTWTKKELELLKIVEWFTPSQLKEILHHSQTNTHNEVEIGSKEIWHAIFWAIGDTHFWSKACNYDWLLKYYERCKERWVKTVLHAGDMVDWYGIYKGQTFELSKHSMQEQVDDVVENYPKIDGIDTYWIWWNHCEWRLKIAGFDIGRMVDWIRDDMHYLWFYNARIKLNGIDIELHHWWWWQSYAQSYKLQKMLENTDPKDQPNVFLLWHFHTAIYTFYRKIHAFTVWAFQWETLLSKRFKLGNVNWWWIIDVSLDDKWGTIINMEFIKV